MVFTNHETRITAFYRMLRPSGGEKCRSGVDGNRIAASVIREIVRGSYFIPIDSETSNRQATPEQPIPLKPTSNGRSRLSKIKCCDKSWRVRENNCSEPKHGSGKQSGLIIR